MPVPGGAVPRRPEFQQAVGVSYPANGLSRLKGRRLEARPRLPFAPADTGHSLTATGAEMQC